MKTYKAKTVCPNCGHKEEGNYKKGIELQYQYCANCYVRGLELSEKV